MLAPLPEDKLQNYSGQVEETLNKSKLSLWELQSVIGNLQFATTVVKVGKAFLRCLYDLTIGVSKLYHKIRLNSIAKEDLKMWVTFLREFNGKSIIYEPSITESNSINMYTDASHAGFEGTYGSYWIQGAWPESWKELNIAVLELYPILLMLRLFGHTLGNSRIRFHCDNIAIVQIINKQSSRDSRIMSLLRPLGLALLKYNISFHCEHLSSEDNYLADAISCFQETDQMLHAAGLHLTKTHVSSQWLPSNYKM